MATKLNFKFGDSTKYESLETPEDGTIYAVNDGFTEEGDTKMGSIYKGNKILGTTVADKLVTKEEILVAGGPIEADGIFDGNKIPAGVSVQEILQKLLCKETYPTPSNTNPTFSANVAAPAITASVANNAVVEIGSSITINNIVAKPSTINKVDAKVSGLTYGYKDSLEGVVNEGTSITSAWSSSPNETSKYSLSASVSGFSALTNSSAEGSDAASTTLAQQSVTAALGANTLSVSETGRSYDATVQAIAPKYIVSNIGNVSEEHKTTEVTGSSITSNEPKSSASFKVTGVYPVYSNISGSSLAAEPSTRLNLQTAATFTFNNVPSEVVSNQHFMFDYPATKTVSSFKVKDLTGTFVDYAATYDKESTTVEKQINGQRIQYKRFATTGAFQGTGTYQITLNSSLDK